MKRSIGVAPRFPGFALASLIVLLAFALAYSVASGASILVDRGVAAFVGMTLYPALVASTFIAVGLVLVRIALSSVRPVPALLILWAELALMVLVVFPLVSSATGWSGPTAAIELQLPMTPVDTVVRSGDVAIIVEGQQGLTMNDTIVVDFSARPRFSRHATATLDPRDNILVPAGGPPLYLGPAFFPAQESAALPATIGSTVDDLLGFASRLSRFGAPWRNASAPVLLEYVLITVLLISLWTFARMSQWLLLNWALVLLALRAFFLVYHPSLLDFAAAELPASLYSFAPSVVMAAIALLLIVVAILLPPVKRWRTEVEHEE